MASADRASLPTPVRGADEGNGLRKPSIFLFFSSGGAQRKVTPQHEAFCPVGAPPLFSFLDFHCFFCFFVFLVFFLCFPCLSMCFFVFSLFVSLFFLVLNIVFYFFFCSDRGTGDENWGHMQQDKKMCAV